MKCKGNRKSKKQKLSLKYNIQKRVREHKRRVRKEAKKLGIKKCAKKDPGIPNTWPFKAQMLQELERKKELREEEIAKKRVEAKKKAKKSAEQTDKDRKQAIAEREADRRQRKLEEAQKQQRASLRKVLTRADVVIQALDARDPMGCRCAALEAWAREKNVRLIFALTKADAVPPQVLAGWLQALAKEAPVVAVAAEAGREGVPDLLKMLGRSANLSEPAAAGAPKPAEHVGVVGYPNTGKQALSKAMRRECGGTVSWLLDMVARLRPEAMPKPLDAALTLHLSIRGALPKGPPGDVAAPLDVLRHLVERTTAQAVMRRFRLPVFEGVEGLVAAFGKDRGLKNKKGKDLLPEAVAKKLLADIVAAPGCFCTPPEAAAAGSELWAAHSAARPALVAVAAAQAQALAARPASPVDGALQLRSGSPGPAVELNAVLAEAEAEAAEDDDLEMDADGESGDDLEGEEGEEEEDGEGDEEEMFAEGDEEMG
mmetsp:Transcript_16165/g.41842  ORF Transcript_16165/g.41842 Transcript_16165/m.41842 type:complete len:485 (+) Transcript_16165:66-1520(+)